MTVGRVQRYAIDTPALLDFLQGPRGERGFAFKGMEHYSLKVTQTHILQPSHRFQNLEQPSFQANIRLNAVDFDNCVEVFCKVPTYHSTIVPNS
jgi:hypothetical protein